MLPPAWLLVSLVVMSGLDFLLPGATIIAFSWTLTGIAAGIAGVALNLAADLAFKRHKTTVKPFALPTSLVDRGSLRRLAQPDVSRNGADPSRVCPVVGNAVAVRRLCGICHSLGLALYPP